jgi:DUF2934 family protein
MYLFITSDNSGLRVESSVARPNYLPHRPMTAVLHVMNQLEHDVTKRKRMESTSRKDTSASGIAAATQVPADKRTASGSVVAGSPSGTDRQMRIAKVAYYKAQQRGFAPGHDWEDWFAAEREVTGSR